MPLLRLFKRYLRECRSIYRAELLILILIVPNDAYHGGIVRSIAELRYVDCPTVTFLSIVKSIAQPVIGTHAAGNCHMLDARFLDGLLQLLHQNVHNSPLQRGGNVLLVLLHEVRIFLYPLLQRIEE